MENSQVALVRHGQVEQRVRALKVELLLDIRVGFPQLAGHSRRLGKPDGVADRRGDRVRIDANQGQDRDEDKQRDPLPDRSV